MSCHPTFSHGALGSIALIDTMAEKFHDHVTPNMCFSSFPDSNALAYHILGVIVRETKEQPHCTNIVTNIIKDHLL